MALVNNKALDRVFTTGDIVEILGIPEWQILNWVKSSFVSPSIRKSAGPGTRRLFSLTDVLEIHTILVLSHIGFDLRCESVRRMASGIFCYLGSFPPDRSGGQDAARKQ